MSEELLTESGSVDTQETSEVVEPVVDAQNESQTNQESSDVWAEDFDVNAVDAVDTVDTVNTVDGEVNGDSKTIEPEDNPEYEYVTEGLGELEKPLVVKVKGKIYDIKDIDQIRDLVERGFNATQKLQEVAAMKRELEKQVNPDLTDADFETSDINDEIESISQEILNSDYGDDIKGIISGLPQDTVSQFSSNPEMLKGLYEDAQSGLASAIMPQVRRYMDIDGMGFKEAYMKAGKGYHESSKANNTKQGNREKIVSSQSRATPVSETKPRDIWQMSDEEYSNLMGTVRN